MKSMLQEASSIVKAVEKAWNEAGKPQEFTIKILEEGEKGFLGLTGGRPAVVSITYQPLKGKKTKIDFEKDLMQVDKKSYKQSVQPQKTQKQSSGIMGSFFGTKTSEKPQNVAVRREQIQQKQKQQQVEKEVAWRKEFVDNVNIWLKEIMMHAMGIDITIDVKHDQRILNVFIDKRVFKDFEEEKLFFISLSHLLMQFLKRKYKKKFTNYYLIIHSKVENNDNRKSVPSNK